MEAGDCCNIQKVCTAEGLISLHLNGDDANYRRVRSDCSDIADYLLVIYCASIGRNKYDTRREHIGDRNILCTSCR